MATSRLFLQPTIRQLLSAEALSEAQILAGEDSLDQQVQQVVFGFSSARAGSLVVAKLESLDTHDLVNLKELAGVIMIKPLMPQTPALASVSGLSTLGGPARLPVSLEVSIEPFVKTFSDARVPLIVVPGLGEPAQVAEDIRMAFQSEIKRSASRLHQYFVSSVLESGLQGLVEELAKLINRPVGVETADFRILAAQNMGPTPAKDQKTLNEEVAEELNRELRSQTDVVGTILPEEPFRIGRRLVMPIILEGVVVGYIAVMVRPTDDLQFIGEYLIPAALAALVDFSHRRKDVSSFTVTQKSLLKDLLSGRTLSAGDQERLEQHFGFDLCDGFIVCVMQVPPESAKDANWPPDTAPMVEMETTKVFVVPYDGKAEKTWQQHVEELLQIVKKNSPDLNVQVGVSRIATNLLDLSDAYREARQALIITSMVQQEKQFIVNYADLGIKRLLYLMIDHPELDRFFEENLGQLEAYDAEWETELVPTLRVYLNHGANLNSAAKELFIHRHTARYRLEQIAEILHVDVGSEEVLLNLQIAFLIRDMKGKSKRE